ncbi:ABC transporter domain-containing protein, partial [Haematococcus lacustris]
MLDEPTSGLDSTTALHLVTLLRDLARGGRAILTTIHQPSSRLYRQLDQVMLLAEGHIMYYGDALRAVDWFDHLGFSLPYGTNLADHILDCAMGEVTHDPSAPGAAQAAASCGVSTHSDEQEDARASRRHQYVEKMRGPVAVRALYTTYESWYLGHPGGF